MKIDPKIIAIGVAVVLGLIAIVAALPFLIPASQYRATLEQAASDGLGRSVRVRGPLRFQVFPNLGLNAEQVAVANAPGGAAPLFADISELDVGVAVLPLLHGDVQVKQLLLKKPVIALEANVGGKPNWLFAPKGKEPGAPAQPGVPGANLKNVGLGDVRVVDGQVSYRDPTGKVQTLSALNAQLGLKNIDSPFSMTSDFQYGGDQVKMTVGVSSPRAFENKQSTPIRFELASPKLTAKLQGVMDTNDFSIVGNVDARGPSLRQLAAWAGSPLGPGPGFRAFSVVGAVKAQGATDALTNIVFTLDAVRGHGDLSITTGAHAPPYIRAVAAIDSVLDANAYMGRAAPAPAAGSSASASAGAPAPAPAKGINVNQGWSKERIDLAGLKAINADLTLNTRQLLFQKMKIDAAHLTIALKDGLMRADLQQLSLYGGRGSGALTLDARGPALRVQQDLSVEGLSAKAFLTDAMGLDKIEGTAKINLSLSGQGSSQQAIMSALDGKAAFTFADGAITGVNLAQVARQIQSVLTGGALGPSAKTDFAEMGANFAVNRGVAHTNDFHLLNPFIRVAGQGDLNLAEQSMDMKITPTVVKSMEGQGGAANLAGLSVPFRVSGPWSKLSFAPDLGALLQNKISNFGKSLGNGGALGNLGDLGKLFGK